MSDHVRIGVLGCSAFAVRRMLPAFAAGPGLEVVAIASRSPERAEPVARRFGGDPVQGYAALLERDDVDAVYVPLPAALHAEWVEAALDAGKHVLAEKPLSADAAQTGRLLALARQRGLALVENVLFVHHPQHEAVRRLVTDGAIGELRSLSAEFGIPAPTDTDIRHRAELGGGSLADVGIYPLRSALHFLGPGIEVVGARLVRGRGREVETSGAVLLTSPEGVVAQLTFGMDHGYLSRYELWGSEGRITVDRAYTPPADFPPAVVLHRDGGREDIRLEPFDQVAAAVAGFVAAVRTGTVGHEATLRQAELLDDIRRRAG
ncbi:Gfo/Idh/MocA family protein [Kitasatospora sp. NPDC056327]|uniref:Gfo/Idh/MocA family protein n=1 Tax=Kitasatospora sp. NPDC056327 TaxID=3345785 RepID=UPI0035DA6DE1